MKFFRHLAVAIVAVSLTHCAANEVQSYPSLANRGILPLSTTNAFLGANLFLARELENSSFLFNFFKGKGAPVAIEIRETQTRPLEMVLFYPREHEVYIGHRQTAGRNSQWITRGPYSISRADFKNIKGMQLSFNGEPVFDIYGKPYRFRFQQQARKSSSVEPEIPIVPKKKPKKKIVKAKPKPKTKKIVPLVPGANHMSSAEYNKLSTDQKAILLSKGYAERSENGDLIHTVKNPTETLSDIAKWYTGSAKNADLLGKANALLPDDTLQRGMRLSIPESLAKKFKAMPTR